eukprot:TRINITY_DN29632_c0_g1_i1.p1 TRINITY_DN29632_c0_g1~~TRINITY_DN29632_c0_g1_i1.p1  ORF type:complete len:209 (-),score=18.64 TRINITY_DN29632_c0_g1_i1:413-1039(-)
MTLKAVCFSQELSNTLLLSGPKLKLAHPSLICSCHFPLASIPHKSKQNVSFPLSKRRKDDANLVWDVSVSSPPARRRAITGRTHGLESDGSAVERLCVPEVWTSPEVASQEAEWLQSRLEQWLDDEFCPEAANKEISRRCAAVFQRCLREGITDCSDILLQMIRDLETFSFKDSFHGSFSSANAAINLVIERVQAMEEATVGEITPSS